MIFYDMSFEGLLKKMQLGSQNKCSGNSAIDIPACNGANGYSSPISIRNKNAGIL
jgi:hypothetical protein